MKKYSYFSNDNVVLNVSNVNAECEKHSYFDSDRCMDVTNSKLTFCGLLVFCGFKILACLGF